MIKKTSNGFEITQTMYDKIIEIQAKRSEHFNAKLDKCLDKENNKPDNEKLAIR